MNVLLWYHAFLEEGLISNVSKPRRGLTVIPLHRKYEVKSLVHQSSHVICDLLFESLRLVYSGVLSHPHKIFSAKNICNVMYTLDVVRAPVIAADESAARAWLLGLPSSVRASVLDSLYTHPRPGRRMLARSEYCRVLASAWRLLYTPDWRGLLLPDTLSLVQQRPDIRTDSPAAQLEDVERVLRRLGVVPATLPPVCSGHVEDGGKGGHVGHAELHCSVYELLLSFPACSARTVQLRPYASKQLHSAREKQLVRALVPQLSHVTQLDLGHAADDVILQQVRAGHCTAACWPGRGTGRCWCRWAPRADSCGS